MDWGGVKCYFYCWLYKEGAVKGDHEVRRVIAAYNLSKDRGLFWAEDGSNPIDSLLTSNVVWTPIHD